MKEQDVQDIRSTIEKMMGLGGHCDCEVLFNVSPEVWQESRDETLTGPDVLGADEWQQFVSGIMQQSGQEKSEPLRW
jgi:hypothetical protein